MTTSAKKPPLPISEPVGRRILGVDQIDDLGEGLLTLMREVFVILDRQMVLEEILRQQGVNLDALEHHEPTPELQARIDAKRDAMVGNVVRAMQANQ